MPGKVKVRIVSARDLPVMDRTSDLADAFVEVRLGNVMHKTDVCKKTLNPHWDSEWFRFEVDDEELQDEPLQIRIMDYDTVTAHDAIGKVNISLSSLLTQGPPGSISGWFPIYDTMHGIRGELLVMVKVDFFVDSNKFRQTSCGVHIFYTCCIPYGFKATVVQGFVEELVVNDDPEYQWIDKIRTPRSSNEARQRIFTKLSGELQRKIGLKVLELGGNAVVGYRQCFDLEGEYGIVVRGIGTAVTLVWLPSSASSTPSHPLSSSGELGSAGHVGDTGFTFPEVVRTIPAKARQHKSSTESEPEITSTPPKEGLTVQCVLASGLESSGCNSGGNTPYNIAKGIWHRATPKQKNIEQMDLPFFTITRFPPRFLRHLGGVVSARSVKLLDKINHPDEPETRDAWWSEVRTEIRSHARSMGCNAVVGYYESTSICEELIVLSATGTAACVDLTLFDPPSATTAGILTTKQVIGISNMQALTDVDQLHALTVQTTYDSPVTEGVSPVEDLTSTSPPLTGCSLCHIPYSDTELPFPITLAKCHICRYYKVPDLLFCTIDPPMETPITGKGCLIQARVCRTKKKEKGEANAEIVSNILPFLEYELHQQLMNKLKVKGMNAIFGIHLQICVGETLIIGIASATAVYLSALPQPPLLKISGKRTSSDEDKRLTEIQRQIIETTNRNRLRFKISESLEPTPPPSPSQMEALVSGEHEEETRPSLDFVSGGKDAFVVEVDDKKDEDVIAVLLDPPTPEGFYCCNTESLPGVAKVTSGVKMITAVQRHSISDEDIRTNQQFAKMFDDTMKSFWFKLRHFNPSCLTNVRFDVEIPEDDNIQFAVSGVVVGMEEKMEERKDTRNESVVKERSLGSKKISTEDLLFPIEEIEDTKPQSRKSSPASRQPALTLQNKLTIPKVPLANRPAVEVTPMSYLPNAQIERYLGNVNLFFIRESLSIREDGGLNVFMQVFLAEAQAILRAHVQALGGNALVSYQLNEMVLLDNPHKHQGQCLLNVSGDAVEVSYEEDGGLADSFGRTSPRKHRTTSVTESIPHSPIKLHRQRSATEGHSGDTITYDPCYGTA